MTDAAYRAWIQTLPSCISGKFSEWLPDIGEWRSIAAHVRRAGKSGVAYKAEYSCIPLTREEHDFQHQHGEFACLRKFLPLRRAPLSEYTAKAWFDEQVEKYRALWEQRSGGKASTTDGRNTRPLGRPYRKETIPPLLGQEQSDGHQGSV